jgi:sterol desaturase/sphingolipid hydroxylase (fatty acid hydroxylase superfamily)
MLAVTNTLILRLVFPLLAVGLAVTVHARSGGLFGQLDWPVWIGIPLAMLLLELIIYWQHRLMHAVPLLWRLHRVHHIDTGFDVTTGVRFHPLEIALSMGIKLGAIWLLGPHPVAVVLFEVLLAAGALWAHTDIALPKGLDRGLRWLVVTPSMHRVHHSTWRPETDSNYGFHLSIWDRVFGSYTETPREDERSMRIGLEEFRSKDDLGFRGLLLNPFRPSRMDKA